MSSRGVSYNTYQRYFAVKGKGKTRKVFAFRSFRDRQAVIRGFEGTFRVIHWKDLTPKEQDLCYDGHYVCSRNPLGFRPRID